MATMIRFSHFQLYLTCLLTLSCNALRISRSVACIGRTAVSFRPNVVLKTLCTPAANGLYSTSSSLQLKGDTSKGIIKADLQLDTNVKAHRRNGEVFTRNPTKRPNTKNAMSQQWITLPPCEPKNAYLNLDYNYLSTTSFATIRHQWKNEDANKLRQGSTATVKGRVGDEFLTKWWQAATKWGLLTGKLKTYYETHFISSKVEAGAGTPPEGEHYYTEIDEEATVFTAKDKSAIDAKIHTLSTCVELSIPISAIPNIPSEEPPAPKGESQELLNDIWAGRISRVLSRHIAQLRHSLEHIAASNKIEEVDAITTYFRNISVSEKLELEVLNKKTKLENEPSYNSKMGRKVKYNATSSGKGFGSAKRDNTVLDVSQLMGKMMEKNEKLALERRQQQWKNALNVHNDGTTVREEKISSSTAKWNSTSTVSPSSEQSVPLSVPAGQRTPNRVRDIIATDINTTQPGAITATDSQNKAAAIVDAPAAAAPVSVPAPGQLQRAGQVPLDVLHEVCRSHIARVICIGDVHGCVVEVCDLLRKVEYAPGDQVLFLGDLVAKGPESVAVVRLAMDLGALSVRGNHDHEVVRQRAKFLHRVAGAAAKKKQERNVGSCSYINANTAIAASGETATATSSTAAFTEWAGAVGEGGGGTDTPSWGTVSTAGGITGGTGAGTGGTGARDSERRLVHTLAQYGLDLDTKALKTMSSHQRIGLSLSPEEVAWLSNLPYYIRSLDLGAVFVHAGLMSGVKLQEQEPWVMMSMRSQLGVGRASSRSLSAHPWAKRWPGPLTVYFGHDTARGLQKHTSAYGIDTGCVYGGNLTAVLLPEQKVVSVPARKTYLKFK